MIKMLLTYDRYKDAAFLPFPFGPSSPGAVHCSVTANSLFKEEGMASKSEMSIGGRRSLSVYPCSSKAPAEVVRKNFPKDVGCCNGT